MKRERLKRLKSYLRRFIDKEFGRREAERQKVIEALAKMKERAKELKEAIREEKEGEKLRRMVQELEVIKRLRKKAKKRLKEQKDNK